MEQARGSADAAPADSSFEEMAGVEEAKQEPDSAAPMDVDDVPMDTEAPGGSSFEEVPAAKEEDTTVPLFNILMILLVRNLPAPTPRSPGKLSLWRGAHTRDEFLCRCLQRSGQTPMSRASGVRPKPAWILRRSRRVQSHCRCGGEERAGLRKVLG